MDQPEESGQTKKEAAVELAAEQAQRIEQLAGKIKGRLESIIGQFPGVTPYGEMRLTSEQQMEVLFRIQDAARWLRDLDGLLREEELLGERSRFRIRISKTYLRHEGHLKHLWHLAVQGRGVSLEDALDHFDLVVRGVASRTMVASPVPKSVPVRKAQLPQRRRIETNADGTTVETVPLIASGARRNEPSAPILSKGSKGAHLIRIGP